MLSTRQSARRGGCDEAPPDPEAAARRRRDGDVAIVGGGYAGLWTALALESGAIRALRDRARGRARRLRAERPKRRLLETYWCARRVPLALGDARARSRPGLRGRAIAVGGARRGRLAAPRRHARVSRRRPRRTCRRKARSAPAAELGVPERGGRAAGISPRLPPRAFASPTRPPSSPRTLVRGCPSRRRRAGATLHERSRGHASDQARRRHDRAAAPCPGDRRRMNVLARRAGCRCAAG